MKKPLLLVLAGALVACSTNPVSPSQGSTISAAEFDATRKPATSVDQNIELRKAEDPICQRIYENYDVVMKAHQPKKRSFLNRIGGAAGSIAQGVVVGAAGTVGGTLAAKTADTAIDSATYNPGAGLSELQGATTIIEVQRTAIRQANDYNCPIAPMIDT